MKRFVTVCLALLLPLVAAGQLKIKSIDISAVVKDNGDVAVTEKRTMLITNSLTEGYIVMDNMGGIEISDFSVSDETGLQYKKLDSWNINSSRLEKAGKCGIVNKGYGSCELCWGLGGKVDGEKRKVYTISYTLGSLVKGYQEADGFNHLFLTDEMDPLPDSVSFSVTVDSVQIDTTNARGWGFGYDGPTEFSGGAFRTHTENYGFRNSLIIMLALKKGIIHPKDSLETPFQDVVDRALEGSDFTDTEETAGFEWMDNAAKGISSLFGIKNEKTIGRISNGIMFLFIGLFFFCLYKIIHILSFIVDVLTFKHLRILIRRWKLKHHLEKTTGSPWWRNIPFNHSIFASQKALNSLTNSYATDISNAIGAYILRLFQKGALSLTIDNGREAFKVSKRENTQMDAPAQTSQRDQEMEDLLHFVFLSASGKDLILQPRELKVWLRAHSSYANKLLKLREKGKYKDNTEISRLLGLKKFLQEFTLIQERGVVEVQLWDEYLVFAALFGIADQVRKQFRQVCPEYFQMSKFAQTVDAHAFTFHNTVNNLAYTTYHAAQNSSIAAARNASASSVWSGGGGSRGGGGGHSSFGGGGGHSGGGHGGGGR